MTAILLPAAAAVYAALYTVDLVRRKKTAPAVGAALLTLIAVFAAVLAASY